MTKRWLLLLMMMLVTLQSLTVAADVHPPAVEPLSTVSAGTQLSTLPGEDAHEHQDTLCDSNCENCCHHGCFHVVLVEQAEPFYPPVASAALPYYCLLSSLPTPSLFRPPKI